MEVALVEALIRWRMPDGTLASPGQFLAVAEESGLIMEISDWVLRSSIEAAAHWHHGEWPDARVAINVSPRQLLDNRFSDRVFNLLQEYNLPTRCIEIELTESVLQTGSATIDALRALRAQGMAIALDDFGTGYSSLNYLHRFPIRTLKIDRSFIAQIEHCKESCEIVHTIIALGHGLGMKVIAEGIENTAQMELLKILRCDLGQGYLFSPPVPTEKVSEMLMARLQGGTLEPQEGNYERKKSAVRIKSWNMPSPSLGRAN